MRSMTRISFTLCALLIAAPVAGQTPSRAALVARIDSLVNAALVADRTPGITVAVVRAADTLVLKGYGLADIENNVPVSPQSVFRIGSLTKQFTAAAVMKLVQEGKIRLDATIADYLPDYQGAARAVTIHQLLTHTGGIPNYTSFGPRFWDRSRLDLTHAEMIALWAADSLRFAPGSRMEYSNSGYYMLGVILEKVTGQPYGDYLRTTQWQPIGLTQTYYCGQREIIPHRAQGYDVQGGVAYNTRPISMNTPGAAGALCSTPRDLVKWTRALVSGRVVTPESYTRMTALTSLSDGTTSAYGYGLSRARLGDVPSIQHSGGINGFGAFLAHYPEQDITIAIVANGPTNTGMLHQRIARIVLGIPETVIADRPTTPEQRARYIGNYDLAPALPLQVRISEQGGRLFAQATGQGAFPLRFQGDHAFEGPDGSNIRIVFTLAGDRVTGFTLHQGGNATSARRIQDPAP